MNLMPVAEEGSTNLSNLVDSKNRFYHLFHFIDQEYNSDVNRLLQELGIAASFGFLFSKIRNRKLQLVFNLFRFGIPTVLMGTTFAHKFKRYYVTNISKNRKTVYETLWDKILKVFNDVDSRVRNEVDSGNFDLGMEIVTWVLKAPKLEKIRILGYYDLESLQKVDSVKLDAKTGNSGSYLILMEYEKGLYGWHLTFEDYMGRIMYDTSRLCFACGSDFKQVRHKIIRRELIVDFVKGLDVTHNHLEFDGWGGLRIVPRPVVIEKISQVDIGEMVREITVVLESGRKRAEALAGIQGTGKSSIVRKLEEILTQYIFVYLNPTDFESPQKIRDRVSILRMIQPFILVIEDFDSCDVATKNEKVGVLLNAIDDVNNTLNAYIIVNINDTSRVHYTIIDRAGRFDRVRNIKPPQSIEEAYQVMLSKSVRLTEQYCNGSKFKLPTFKNFNKPLLEECLKLEFTQADLTNAVLEKVYIDCKIEERENKDFSWLAIKGNRFNELFRSSLESHRSTKKAIKDCNFNNKDPMIYADDGEVSSEVCEDESIRGN